MHAAQQSTRAPRPARRQPAAIRRGQRGLLTKAGGVPSFPDKQATVFEVKQWKRTGRLPERIAR